MVSRGLSARAAAGSSGCRPPGSQRSRARAVLATERTINIGGEAGRADIHEVSGRSPGVTLAVTAALLTCLAGPAHARQAAAADRAGGDLGYVAVNALVGGLMGGVASRARGRSFLDGFARGFLGGAVSYLGKRVSGAAFAGAGLVGRQIGAAGASMVRSAAFGTGLLDTLVVPLGPARVYLALGEPARSTFRLDLDETAWLLYGITSDRLAFDVDRSLSAGSLVFMGEGGLRGEEDTARGRAAPGIISLRQVGDGVDEASFAHERVHVVQFDYLKIVQGLPSEGWVREQLGIGWGSALHHVDVGVGQYPLVWMISDPWFSHSDQILEIEAEHIEALREVSGR